MSLDVGARRVGDLTAEQRRMKSKVARAIRIAVSEEAKDEQGKFRADMGALGGKSIAGTWRVADYPKGAGTETLSPASLIYSRAPRIVEALSEGVVIRAGRTQWRLVPNGAVWPGGRVRGTRLAVGQRTPTFALAEKKFGPLQFIRNRDGQGGRFVARVRVSKKTGKFSRRKAGQAAQQEIVVFWAVRETKMPRLLRTRQIRDEAVAGAGRDIGARFDRTLAALNAAGAASGGGAAS